MRFIRKFVPAIVTASLLIGLTGGSALADTTTPPHRLAVHCDQGVCTVEMGLEGVSPLAKAGAALGISALKEKLGVLPAGARLEIDDTLALSLPVGEIVLPKAQLAVEIGEDNRIERLHGTAEMSFPTLGALKDVRMVQPAMAEVGLEAGKNLSHLHAPLDPERQYLFLNVVSGFGITSNVDGTGDSLDLSAPAGQQVTLVIDTEQPLVYLGGAWVIDAGAFPRRLGIEAQPLAVEGLLTLTPKGMLLDGVVRSSIEPETVFDGEAKLTALIPFKSDLAGAFVATDVSVAIPFAKAGAGATAKISWPLDVEAAAQVTTPFSKDAVVNRPAETQAFATPAVERILHAAGDLATQGARAASKAATRSGDWITQNAGAGLATVSQWLPSKAFSRD